jgi:hypothetical protein
MKVPGTIAPALRKPSKSSRARDRGARDSRERGERHQIRAISTPGVHLAQAGMQRLKQFDCRAETDTVLEFFVAHE